MIEKQEVEDRWCEAVSQDKELRLLSLLLIFQLQHSVAGATIVRLMVVAWWCVNI